jgi:outer membrane protein assembly factor BamB
MNPNPEHRDLNPEHLIIGSNGYASRIDVITGEELWRTKLLPGLLGGSSCTDVLVLVRGEFVFAGTYGNLFCLALDTGRILWRNELKGMGYNDVTLAMEGVAIQFLTKVAHSSSSAGST